MTESDDTETRKKFLSLLGEIAINFADLEYSARRLLDRLINPDDFLADVTLTDDLGIARIINKLRTIGQLRLRDERTALDDLEHVLTRMDKLRVMRNKFIHGRWIIDSQMLAAGHVLCLSERLRFDKRLKVWSLLDTETLTVSRLESTAQDVQGLRDRIEDIIRTLPTLKLAFFPYPPEQAERQPRSS